MAEYKLSLEKREVSGKKLKDLRAKGQGALADLIVSVVGIDKVDGVITHVSAENDKFAKMRGPLLPALINQAKKGGKKKFILFYIICNFL